MQSERTQVDSSQDEMPFRVWLEFLAKCVNALFLCFGPPLFLLANLGAAFSRGTFWGWLFVICIAMWWTSLMYVVTLDLIRTAKRRQLFDSMQQPQGRE